MQNRNEFKLLQILEITDCECALELFKKVVTFHSKFRPAWESIFWVPGPNPATAKPPSIAEVASECVKIARVKSVFRFYWKLKSGQMEENWSVAMHFTRFPRIEYIFDIGGNSPLLPVNELLESGLIERMCDGRGEARGKAFALYFFQKINSNNKLRKWGEKEARSNKSLYVELKQALLRSNLQPEIVDTICSFRENKDEIRKLISQWDERLSEILGTTALENILERWEIALKEW